MSDRLRLADLLGGLSVAADLGFGLPPEEAMRSCLIATGLAREQGLAEEEVADCFYTALLMHVGCSALSHESTVWGDELVMMRAVAQTNVADPADVAATLLPALTQSKPAAEIARIERYAMSPDGQDFGRRFDIGSCEVGSQMAKRAGLGAGVQQALLEASEWWNGGGPRGTRGEEIAIAGRIGSLAADAARFAHLGGPDAATAALRGRSGVIHDPGLVEAFTAGAETLVAAAHGGDPRERVLEVEPEPVIEMEIDELPRVAAAFGDLADMKTPWTHGHSGGVARLAKAAAESLRLDRQAVFRVEVAALLADLGRLAVSDTIWEKPGPLTSAEWEQVRMHPYHSERILATAGALEPMARTAGMHHERLDSSGYHRGCGARELPVAARVLAAADAFHAMTRERPHRPALTAERAAGELKGDVRAGRIDADAAGAVLEAARRRPVRQRENLRPAGLSEREVEVARLVAAGLSNPQIADRLVIARRTAEHHVQHIYAKVGVSSRAGLALFVHEHELVAR